MLCGASAVEISAEGAEFGKFHSSDVAVRPICSSSSKRSYNELFSVGEEQSSPLRNTLLSGGTLVSCDVLIIYPFCNQIGFIST